MTDRLKVTILGCASSGGVPRIGNDWGNCDPTNPRNRRMRCALLVQRVSSVGTTTVVIDTGPDLRQQMLDQKVQDIDAVIYTHAHADHIHGIDDLRMFSLMKHDKVDVYMDVPTYDRALSGFGYCFVRPEGSSYPPILERHELTAGALCTVKGEGGDLTFLPVEVQHGDIKALGFRFYDIAYLPDVSDIPPESVDGFADLRLWIIDCLRRPPHNSHFNLEKALAWVDRMQPHQAILTNLHNDLDYSELAGETADNIQPAYDGLTVEFDL